MRIFSGVSARLCAVLFSWGVVCSSSAGELRGALHSAAADATSPSEAPSTPPTAWEIPLPFVPASPPKKIKSERLEGLLVLIPRQPGKRPKAPLIALDGSKTKPNPGFISLRDTVTFSSKQEATLLFSDNEKPLFIPKKKKITKGFSKEGVYRYTSKESPSLDGLIIVGTGAKTAEVEESFRVKSLEDGAWSVYLVTPLNIVYAGEVNISEQKEASIEIELP